ncbi:hypothetical protein [Marinobacterium marinum]|uniref:Uncharacterized protein n=1 Tax=Marinobacterium marinum TaxID=2756129 RepID=A0A7W2ABU3_9GAMM|nr:hypothetical protein [Marinobacterium marinum]MBA4501837.1 hypothetical protein [Marinobacterium marinum]
MNAPVTATIEADHADDLEPCPTQQAEQCSRLWASALALYLQDAIRHATGGKKPFNVPDYELEAAFDDVCRLGPMTRHLCQMTGTDPEWLQDQFKQAVLEIRDGERTLGKARR